MVRAPCCENMGLKKGPWTPEEDKILINYINLYGHGNWRALPRQAGLLRCGKSCRLRWTNYLRPDIKRGNFTKEEEDTIISLHETLGNRWSAIAAKLPGRTDNEIKNVWHTHLKKRLNKQHQSTTHETKKEVSSASSSTKSSKQYKEKGHAPVNSPCSQSRSSSPQQSTSGISHVANDHNDNTDKNRNSEDNNNANNVYVKEESFPSFIDVDEDFWSEVLSPDNSNFISNEFERLVGSDIQCQVGLSSSSSSSSSSLPIMDTMQVNSGSVMSDYMEFWSDLFARAGELTELPDFD